MALDPGTTKIDFYKIDEPAYVTVQPHKQKAILACVYHDLSLRPHIEIIEAAPGEFKITCRKKDNPRKVWFETECLQSFRPKHINKSRWKR